MILEFRSDLIDAALLRLDVPRALVERAILRTLSVYGEMDALTGPALSGIRTFVTLVQLPRQLTLRVWWFPLPNGFAILNIGLRDQPSPDDWEAEI